jgi:short-subunit dehydrogenase
MDSPSDRRLALVTGASSGIGFELAKQFAEHGFDLLVVAEDEAIADAARELQGTGGDVKAVRADLATQDGLDELYRSIRAAGRPLDAVALNAGIGAGGAFATDTDLSDELKLIDLNVRSTVHVAKHVLREMVGRGEGRVLFTSSIASTMPGSITLLMPGPTETEFFERADMLDTRVGQADKDDPADVARDGFEALMAGKERVESASLATKLQGRGSRALPDRAKAKLHRRMAEPKSADR